MLDLAPIYELHVKPTYSVVIPQHRGKRGQRTAAQIENQKNLMLARNIDPVTGEKIKRRNQLSKKAVRRLSNAINWLVASAPKKWVYEKKSKKRFQFQVNFVTLTLPTTEHDISDNHFKKVMLHNFINTCRSKFGLKNYVWKVEAQENGNIHAHFTTDTFIHWQDLRKVWNKILASNGVLEPYTKKHSKMSFEEYNSCYNPEGKRDVEKMRKAFEYGCATNWRDPNSTDIHSVYNVKDLAAYLAKYMGKSEEDRREINGRLWGCSYNLSDSNKLIIELCGNDSRDITDELYKDEIKWKPIETVNKLTGQINIVGDIFFHKLSDWGSVLKGRLLSAYNEHRFNIRHCVDVAAIKNVIIDALEPPEIIEIIPISKNQNSSNQLNFI